MRKAIKSYDGIDHVISTFTLDSFVFGHINQSIQYFKPPMIQNRLKPFKGALLKFSAFSCYKSFSRQSPRIP